MTQITNIDAITAIRDAARISNVEAAPTELGKTVVPIIDMTPDFHRLMKVAITSVSDATSGVIFTTSTTRRTFVVGSILTLAKDVLSPSLYTEISVAPFATVAALAINIIRYEPTTAGQFTNTAMFPIPLELKKGTNVSIGNSSATASIDVTGIVFYYEVDP